MLKKALVLPWLMMGFVTQAWAQSFDTSRYEAALNAMHTLEGRFEQYASDGSVHRGRIHLSRPGRLRLDYDAPSPLLIVADGQWLITYDKDLDEVTYVSLDNTPAGFILRPFIKFSGDVAATGMTSSGDQTTTVTVQKTEAPEEGSIALVFGENPTRLKEWTVVDGQGNSTLVKLFDLKINGPIANSLFKFDSPSLVEKVF